MPRTLLRDGRHSRRGYSAAVAPDGIDDVADMNTRLDRIEQMAMHRGFAQPYLMWRRQPEAPTIDRRDERPQREVPLVLR